MYNGLKIKELRIKKHYWVKEVSDHIGYSPSKKNVSYRRIESWERNMRWEKYRKLFELLKLTDEEINYIKELDNE